MDEQFNYVLNSPKLVALVNIDVRMLQEFCHYLLVLTTNRLKCKAIYSLIGISQIFETSVRGVILSLSWLTLMFLCSSKISTILGSALLTAVSSGEIGPSLFTSVYS